MKTAFKLLIILCTCSLSANSQSFINGDLEGIVDSLDPFDVPPGWFAIPDTEPYCLATSVYNASPNITGEFGPYVNYGIIGIPYSGQTFVSGLFDGGGSYIWHEGIEQTVSDFIPGMNYEISFYQANVKQETPSAMMTDESAAWSVYIDGILIGTSASTVSTLAFDDVDLGWEYREMVFTATDTAHRIGFLPADDDPSVDGMGEGLRMGIDAISLEESTANLDEALFHPVSIYPNPTTNFVNIDLKNEAHIEVEVINSQGQIILTKEINAGEERRIELDGESGLYFIKVRYEEEWKFFKVVKQ